MRTSLAPQGVGLGPGPPAVYVSLRGFCLSLFFIGKILVYFVLCRPIGGSSFRPSSGYCLVTYFRPPAHETMPHPPLSSLLCVHDANQPRFDSGFTLRCNWICCNNPPAPAPAVGGCGAGGGAWGRAAWGGRHKPPALYLFCYVYIIVRCCAYALSFIFLSNIFRHYIIKVY